MRKVLMGGLCLAVLGGLYVLGQDREAPREGRAATRSHRATELLGATVSLKGGDSLGKILDLVIDDRGTIEYLIVRVDQGLLPVPWGAVNMDAGDRAVTITITGDLSRDRLKDIIFTEKAWPDFYSERWIRSATDVWGERALRPGVRPDFRKDEPRRDDLRKDTPRKDELRRDDVRKDDVRKDDVRKDDFRRDDVRKDDVRKDDFRKDTPRKDDPRKDDPRKDDPRKDDLRKDTPRKDDPRKDDLRKDDPRKDDLRKDDPRKDDLRKDTPRKDDLRKDDLRKDAPVKDRGPGLPPDRPPQ